MLIIRKSLVQTELLEEIHGDLYRRRTDIVGFVNGIPLLFIELKKNSVDVQNAYTDNYTDYLDTIPQLFYYNTFLMLSLAGITVHAR